jgi:hypothetical protein
MNLLTEPMTAGPRAVLLAFLCGMAVGCGPDPSPGGGSIVGEADAATPPSRGGYVPAAPIAYDGKYLDGSFEENPGFGWDTCRTRTPERLSVLMSGSSEGSYHLSFETASGCSESGCRADAPSSSQVYLWFKAPPAIADAGLYLDVKNLAGTPPEGTLRFYGTDHLCEQEVLLAEVALGELSFPASPAWGTRCVTLTRLDAHIAIGIAVTGGDHAIGIDALRVGRPCDASP